MHGGRFDVRDAVLVVSSETGVQTLRVPTKPRFVLGRSAACDVVVADESVSREHAAFFVLDGAVRIEDLGSRNATKVAGRTLARGESAAVDPGVVVVIGTASLFLQRTRPSVVARPRSVPAGSAIVLDPTMAGLFALLDVVAPSPLSVLLLGETGTGKEVFAESIHARSPRAQGPLVRVNCAGLTGSLLESELFGHEKGAFTGAASAKPGLFEAADGGTLFLDEIGEMPLETQAKVLRAIETREVTRLGSNTPRRVDVRFVAATHRDLARMIADGGFRSDLFFRLNGFTMSIPPLRQRTSEIVPLARAFLARAAGKEPWSLDPRAEAALEAYPWPGNVRELRTAMERAWVLAGPSKVVSLAHLVLDAPAATTAKAAPDDEHDLRVRRAAWEREQIEAVLARTGWSQKDAAAALGFSVRTLQTKITQLGIARPKRR